MVRVRSESERKRVTRNGVTTNHNSDRKQQALELVICDDVIPLQPIIDQEAFRQLANDIMEEYPESDSTEESVTGSVNDNDGPTFTYPADGELQSQKEYDIQEPWIHLLNSLESGNERLVRLLSSIGINPVSASLCDFYYNNYEPTSERHHEWVCLESLNNIISDDSFRTECLSEEWNQ